MPLRELQYSDISIFRIAYSCQNGYQLPDHIKHNIKWRFWGGVFLRMSGSLGIGFFFGKAILESGFAHFQPVDCYLLTFGCMLWLTWAVILNLDIHDALEEPTPERYLYVDALLWAPVPCPMG